MYCWLNVLIIWLSTVCARMIPNMITQYFGNRAEETSMQTHDGSLRAASFHQDFSKIFLITFRQFPRSWISLCGDVLMSFLHAKRLIFWGFVEPFLSLNWITRQIVMGSEKSNNNLRELIRNSALQTNFRCRSHVNEMLHVSLFVDRFIQYLFMFVKRCPLA